MKEDNTTARLKDILFSLSVSKNIELKDRVLPMLSDFKYLDNEEKDLLKEYIKLAQEVNGVPTEGTLLARNINYQDSLLIREESLIDFVNIFLSNKQTIKMHSLIHKGLEDYQQGKIPFSRFDAIMQDALVVGSPSKVEENLESNLDLSFYESLATTERIQQGVKFGIQCIDECYRGLLPGDILTIAGYTGSMKTTLASNLVYNGATQGKNTLYISLEVSKEDLTEGLLSRHSRSNMMDSVTRSDIKRYAVEEKDNYMKLVNSYLELPGKIRIIDERDITTYSTSAFNEIIDIVNKEMIERTGHKIDIIVLDHAQLLKFNDSKSAVDNPYLVVNYYTSYFREKAAREGYAVVLVSQTSRQGYEYACKHNGEYLESGLAEANELERASTGIITVFTTENGKKSNEITIQLIKNRFGKRMIEPEQAPLFADYFMIGTGVSLESEDVSPVFTDNDIYKMDEKASLNLDEILLSNL
ncbi:MAG: AAA family ATPase [Bacilli bacterium]|nr:AAA family ATPase [Bacilli bacterium]